MLRRGNLLWDTPRRTDIMTDGASQDPVVEAYKQSLDLTLLRRNLQKSPEERILAAMELLRLADEVRRAGRAVRGEP